METTSAARTIVPLMVFATGIALVGHTLEPSKSKASPQVGDAQILLGGTIATVILTLLAQGGDVGQKFGKGLALVALLSSVGLYGGSLATGIDKVTGQVTPQGAKAATPTTPTKGTK
jgi:hypothetical protein